VTFIDRRGMQSSNSHSLKVTIRTPRNELDIRRIKVQNSIDYQELVEILQQMFQLDPSKDLLIQYEDNDKEPDLCTITNDLELNEAFNAKKGEILKLILTAGTPRESDPETTKESVNKSGNETSEDFCNSSQEVRYFITDAFNRFVESMNPIIENFEKNAEMINASLPNPKAILEQLKPIFESFLNEPSASFKKPFRSFVNDLDRMLAEIDLWMHQKSFQEAEPEPSTESSDQPSADSFLHPFKDFFEKVMNETKSFIQDLNEWLTTEFDLWTQQKSSQDEEEADPEPTPERSDQPFTDSIIRPFKDLFEKVISDVEIDSTKADVEEVQLFDQQMQELRKMGFLDDDQNLAILIQTKGDLLSAVIVLLDSEST
jgi:hypothetical protein